MALKKLKKLYKTSSSSSSSSSSSDVTTQTKNLKTRLEASGVSTDSRNWLQKALNLEEGTGFLAGLGDVLDRASGGASVKAMIAGDTNKSSLENAWDAFTGKQRYSGVDVLEALNPDFKNASGVEKFIGGLATDIFLDPTTYLSMGASALGKNATNTGAKLLGQTDNLTDVTKILKNTKTIDQATDLVKTADKANDLLKAGKAYRTADVLDTIANPLKLIPQGIKKTGEIGLETLKKYSPNTAEAITDLGQQLRKTFDYKGFLKKHLGESSYDSLKNAEALADMSQEYVSYGSAGIQKKLDDMLKIIKKDPDRVYQLTSNVDGSISDFTFKGLSDSEILKKLNEFAVNQVYFNRPTVIDENTIKSLVKNKGRVMLPVQSFKNEDDIEILENLLKETVDDPDLVSIAPYVQKETGKSTGYVISIGEKNVKSFSHNIQNLTYDILKQEDIVTKKKANLTKASMRFEKNQTKLDKTAKQIDKLDKTIAEKQTIVKNINKQIDDLTTYYNNGLKEIRTKYGDDYETIFHEMGKLAKEVTEKKEALRKNLPTEALEALQTKRNKLNQNLSLIEANLNRIQNSSLEKALNATEVAEIQLDDLLNKQNSLNDLMKTRELVPYEMPKINLEGMEDVAKIQKQTIDMNLGIRNLNNLDMSAIDKYDNYIHKKLTEESKNYLASKGSSLDPATQYIVSATDHLPSQNLTTSIYGNFSPTEVNTMIGRDLFDSNIVASNFEMVKQLNRKNYNAEMTKVLFSGDNDFILDTKPMSIETITDLKKQGYVKVKASEVSKKLKLGEILNEDAINNFVKDIKGKEFLVSKEALELFDKNAKLYQQLDSAFYQQLNKYMKYWKGGNLLSVGYHLRNLFGAQANMALAGMGLDDIAKYTTQAGLDINKYNSKLLPKFREWITVPENAKLFKTADADTLAKAFAKEVGEADAKTFVDLLQCQSEGIIGSIVGQHNAVKRAISEMPTSKLGKFTDAVQDINYKLGATVDDMNRLASYRWAKNSNNYYKVSKVGAKNAKDFVNYAMFDFKAMSPTEQAYFTKLFPFYNFIKNNLSFQFSNIMKNGANYKNLAKAYNNLYDAQGLTNDDVQSYVKDQLYIPIRQSDGTIKVLKIAPPVQDATNLLQLKNLLGASNPLIQYITDRAYDQDLYTGKTLSSDRTQNVQELTDLIPYGRLTRTLASDPLSILGLPISTTSVEKANSQNAYNELTRLQTLQKKYKNKTGNSLPTLEDLGLSK